MILGLYLFGKVFAWLMKVAFYCLAAMVMLTVAVGLFFVVTLLTTIEYLIEKRRNDQSTDSLGSAYGDAYHRLGSAIHRAYSSRA